MIVEVKLKGKIFQEERTARAKPKVHSLFRECQGNLVMAMRKGALEKKLKIQLEKKSRALEEGLLGYTWESDLLLKELRKPLNF